MRADRLLSILLLLQNYGKMTSRELAEKLEVSERTIFRDMEALSAASIPVYAERGAGGGWVLSEGYKTNLTGMKTEEILSLLLSNPSKQLDDLGIKVDFEAVFQKLLAASPKSIKKDAEMVRQRMLIDGASWHQSDESFEHLRTVQEAVWEERKLYMQYRREEVIVERVVHPLGIVAKRNVWYLVAESDGDMRTYRISRLMNARMLEESFERPVDFDLERYWEQSMDRFKKNLPRYPARLRINEKLRTRIGKERYTKIMRSHETKEGCEWTELDIEFETLESACEIILSYGPLVEVLAPEELRAKVVSQVKAIASIYTNTL
ncbi:Predicted DNA-binding transcriptional regulator YafY, contains an HTH and WYL domains [Seinonella peptonophila]|uniref:Predicted DNA-binding transcriptional regulator YafY, contains an HTH and WYL domains n=1 Tax=Seinonella peptonophila TaxID=112248 RepID=A0A1M4TYD6_9BACL|nr:YafY family protein [Seinonella peptonophila]SHE49501.1 Predicted DNA-binding transcriptional regulator YafY, contains an HTH and WYL domains [Seinonella peptonophila]